jgi:riboflavin synthase
VNLVDESPSTRALPSAWANLYTVISIDWSRVANTKKPSKKLKIGVVDTMFARYDMGAAARTELQECPGYGSTFTVVSKTVPGFKDLAVAAKNLIERDGCSIVVALGMPGGAPIDKQCAHEAAQGIMQAQLLTSTPILEVFVHEDESDDPAVLASVFENRSRKHARNAYWMLFEPDQLASRAGQGVRQGFEDAGPLTQA